MIKLTPLPVRIAIKRDTPEEVTSGGIIVPDTAKRITILGTVTAVYKPRLEGDPPPLVKVGDRVLVGKYAGSDHEFDGEPVLIVQEDEILAITEEKKK